MYVMLILFNIYFLQFKGIFTVFIDILKNLVIFSVFLHFLALFSKKLSLKSFICTNFIVLKTKNALKMQLNTHIFL